MTKDNWIKAFDEKFSSEWWYGFGTTDDINKKGIDSIKDFISQVEKDAIEKGRKEERGRIHQEFVKIAQQGSMDPDELKGLYLYSRTLAMLKEGL